MRSPSDSLSVGVVLAHQVRAISGHGLPVDTVLLRNWPPWVGSTSQSNDTQQSPLEQFNGSGILAGVTTREVEYAGLHSAGFLGQYFDVRSPNTPRNATVGELLKRPTDGFGTSGKQLASNFMGLLTFLQLCSDAGDKTGLCIYLDPDVFLYRGARGLADLAPATFEAHPDYVGLQPPTVCDGHEAAMPRWRGEALCRASPAVWWSSRCMILNRSRLLREMPIPVEASRFNHFFETVFNGALRARTGSMRCGAETFAVHPPSRHLRRLLNGLPKASLDPVFNHSAVTTGEGLSVLLHRLEGGKFELPSQRSPRGAPPGSGARGCKEPLASNLCWDLLPSARRVEAGLAW